LKKPMKKLTLGGKKAGLGAQKVKMNINEVEQKANEFDKERDFTKTNEKAAEEDSRTSQTVLSSKFLVQEIEKKKKADERAKDASNDPTKAEQLDRLGIGGGGRGRVSHSIASEMRAIQQEGVAKSSSKKIDRDPFSGSGPPAMDDWVVLSGRVDDEPNTKAVEEREEFFDAWDRPSHPSSDRTSRPTRTPYISAPAPSSDEAVRKFKNAKAISSDQFFGNGNDMDSEARANLTKFEGQSAIGSAELFGGKGGASVAGGSSYYSSYADHVPELADIKDSVKGAASKVAGKLSNIGSSVSSYLSNQY